MKQLAIGSCLRHNTSQMMTESVTNFINNNTNGYKQPTDAQIRYSRQQLPSELELGHRVNGSSVSAGSPGHHCDPV